jgi:predicted MFS family arabinose efflux permease
VLPSMSSLVATHVASTSKARALGFIFTGFHCGNLAGLTVSPYIISEFGWKALFGAFGLLGIPLVLMWNLAAPSKKRDASAQQATSWPTKENNMANVGGQQRTKHLPIRALLSSPAVLAIATVNVVNHWGYFIFLSWIPSFFNAVYGLNMRESSFMAFVPWIAMALGSSFAGVVADKLVLRWPVCSTLGTRFTAAWSQGSLQHGHKVHCSMGTGHTPDAACNQCR